MFRVRIHDTVNHAEYEVDYLKAEVPTRGYGPPYTNGLVGLPDNGALVSCGLSVGTSKDDVTRAELDYLIRTGQVRLIPNKELGHGGCLSRCVLRGDDRCQW